MSKIDLLDEYLFDKSAKYYGKLESLVYILLSTVFDVHFLVAIFVVAETLDFLVWYYVIRSGKLSERAEKIEEKASTGER